MGIEFYSPLAPSHFSYGRCRGDSHSLPAQHKVLPALGIEAVLIVEHGMIL